MINKKTIDQSLAGIAALLKSRSTSIFFSIGIEQGQKHESDTRDPFGK